MHDNVFKIDPPLHFPKEVVFEIPDHFNGPSRGTFYYRTWSGTLRGPFANEVHANFHLLRELDNDGA